MSDAEIELKNGLWWPKGIKPTAIPHALRHVRSLEVAIGLCRNRRRAIQAGGNVGLWPRRLAAAFAAVETFEPEPLTYNCLAKNVASYPNITARNCALGEQFGQAGIVRESLASHHLTPGDSVEVRPIDFFDFDDVDLIQLDIEGYELRALLGADRTIAASRPLIQLEMRDFANAYGSSNAGIEAHLSHLGYMPIVELPGHDLIFGPREFPTPLTMKARFAAAQVKIRSLVGSNK